MSPASEPGSVSAGVSRFSIRFYGVYVSVYLRVVVEWGSGTSPVGCGVLARSGRTCGPVGGGWGPPLADERRGRVPSRGLRQCGIRGGNGLEPRRVCRGGGRTLHLAEFGVGMGTPPSGAMWRCRVEARRWHRLVRHLPPWRVPGGRFRLAASGRRDVMPGHAERFPVSGGNASTLWFLPMRRSWGDVGRGPGWRLVGWDHGGVVRGGPAIGISMMRAVSWGGLMMACGLTLAQGPPPEADPALWEAVASGWTSEDAEVLMAAGWPAQAPQQTVVRSLGLERGSQAVRCLLSLPGWPARLQLRSGQGSDGGRTRGQVQWRLPLEAFVWRGRMSTEGGVGTLWTSTLSGRLPSGQWAVGSLMPKVGQGAMLWSAGAFEGLGGMEETHRLPSGWIPAWGRQRGVLDGLAWKRTEDTSRPSTGLHGALMGQWWRGGRLLAVWGRLAGVRMVWRWGNGPSSRGRWAWGSQGGGEWRGWSARWGAAAFPGGWAARGSVLRSWTAAHGLDRPALGEWRASVPEGGARGWVGRGLWSTGLCVWHGMADATPRPSGESAGHPDTYIGKPMGEGEWGTPEEGLRVRLHLLASGQGSQRGGALALTGRWAARVGAPAAYVTGWDDRVAHRFQGRQQQAFLRWRAPGGRWECRIRWPAPWCDVDFHPHRRRPRPR